MDIYISIPTHKELCKKINKKFCSKCISEEWKARNESLKAKPTRGCCCFCACRKGYFRTTYIKSPQFARLKKKYWVNDKDGFFDPEKKSCNLPHSKKSCICRNYFCREVKDKLNSQELATLFYREEWECKQGLNWKR